MGFNQFSKFAGRVTNEFQLDAEASETSSCYLLGLWSRNRGSFHSKERLAYLLQEVLASSQEKRGIETEQCS
jgi:hypothetical protein